MDSLLIFIVIESPNLFISLFWQRSDTRPALIFFYRNYIFSCQALNLKVNKQYFYTCQILLYNASIFHKNCQVI